tara:strand:+ start:1433 stop:3139 length:1707 start_codon:yes stop_codon:yes gene_type:complete
MDRGLSQSLFAKVPSKDVFNIAKTEDGAKQLADTYFGGDKNQLLNAIGGRGSDDFNASEAFTKISGYNFADTKTPSASTAPADSITPATPTTPAEEPAPVEPIGPRNPIDSSANVRPTFTPTGEELKATQYQDFLYPSLAEESTYTPSEFEIDAGDFFDDVSVAETIVPDVAIAETEGLQVTTPTLTEAPKYQSYVAEGTPEYEAARGIPSAESLIGDIQGTVSEASVAQAAQGELDERATVKYQMGQLFSSFEEGKPPPAWAAPAVRKVGAMMSARGLGKSSMAAAAITQAMMEAGIPIAAADAKFYATIQLQNLNNRQASALQNAMTFAAMDKQNLNNRMQAAVNNSQIFLNTDLTNLKNQQQLKTIDLQLQFQKLFNDQAQENASRQFNAKSQSQIDQFFAELDVQVQNANASRMAAMNQFNADQANATDRYFAKINDARERFNIQNEAIINQSNVSWRRNINTANTTQQNEANRLNALNTLQLQNNALNRLWQRYRDEASWAIQANENDAQRAHSIAILAQQQNFNAEQYKEDRENKLFSSIGTVAVGGIFNLLGNNRKKAAGG